MSSEADNVRVWDGEKRGHYEVWYMTFNHRPSQTGYWIRYTMESPLPDVGEPYAQLWFARFDARDPSRTFAINKRLPIDEMLALASPFSVSMGNARLTHDGALGRIIGDGHDVTWDLSWIPATNTHRQLPRIMYRRAGLGDTTVLTPNVDVPITGTIEVDGERFELSEEPGGQTHLWGRKHAHAWAWGHCNAFEDRLGAAFETLTVRLKRRGRVLPPMTILCLYVDGRTFRWNDFRDVLLTRGDYGTARYTFRATGIRAKLEGEYTCRPEDMVVATYHDPDGETSYCSNTEVADLRITLFERSGPLSRWRESERLVAPRTGHFEVGGRQRDVAVEKDHVAVE